MGIVVDLGQVSAIKISSVAPTNVKLIWYDTNVVSGSKFKYYDVTDQAWKLLFDASGGVDDSQTILTKTWSSAKIAQELQALELAISNIDVEITSLDVTLALGYTPENIANKNEPDGYAGLGQDGNVPENLLPEVHFANDDFTGTGTLADPISINGGSVQEFLESRPNFGPNKVIGTNANSEIVWLVPYGYATGNTTPPAPTSLIIDDTANTATWTLAAGYVAADHEYSINYTAGTPTWTTASSNSVNIGDVAIASGDFAVRVKAATGRNVSSSLISSSAFTISGGGSYTLEQTVITNFGNNFFSETISGVNQFLPSQAEATTNSGYAKTNLVNTSNVATGIDMAIGQAFGGAANSFAAATGNAQLYSDLMVNSALSSVSAAADGTLIISGLDDTKFYHFYLTASSNGVNTGVQWTIGAEVRTKVTTDNYPTTAGGDKYSNAAVERIYNIQPTGGIIAIGARKSGAAYEHPVISVLEFERSNIAKV